MPSTRRLSKKSFGSRVLDTLLTLLSGRLPAALQFQVSLKQEGSASLAMWWSLAAHPFEVASPAACNLRYHTVGMVAAVRDCFFLRLVSVSKIINI